MPSGLVAKAHTQQLGIGEWVCDLVRNIGGSTVGITNDAKLDKVSSPKEWEYAPMGKTESQIC